MDRVMTLVPGYLVSLKTSIRGNVEYTTEIIDSEHLDATGALVAKWETGKRVAAPAEQERAVKARGLGRTAIQRPCSASNFGLLCPTSRLQELIAGIAEARKIASEFNATADFSRISINVMLGKVSDNDTEAIRAINSEITELMEKMTAGIRDLDAATIREAANKARALGQMLTPDADSKVKEAINAARKTARAIVNAGDGAAIEVDQEAIKAITASRLYFLDLSDESDTGESAPLDAPDVTGRALDLVPPDDDTAPVIAPDVAPLDSVGVTFDEAEYLDAAREAEQFANEALAAPAIDFDE